MTSGCVSNGLLGRVCSQPWCVFSLELNIMDNTLFFQEVRHYHNTPEGPALSAIGTLNTGGGQRQECLWKLARQSHSSINCTNGGWTGKWLLDSADVTGEAVYSAKWALGFQLFFLSLCVLLSLSLHYNSRYPHFGCWRNSSGSQEAISLCPLRSPYNDLTMGRYLREKAYTFL